MYDIVFVFVWEQLGPNLFWQRLICLGYRLLLHSEHCPTFILSYSALKSIEFVGFLTFYAFHTILFLIQKYNTVLRERWCLVMHKRRRAMMMMMILMLMSGV